MLYNKPRGLVQMEAKQTSLRALTGVGSEARQPGLESQLCVLEQVTCLWALVSSSPKWGILRPERAQIVVQFSHSWTAARQASLSITNSWSLLKLMSIKSVIPPNHLILCRPLLLLPLIFPSIRVFSNESVLHIRWTKYWSFNFSISLSNEYSELISLRMDSVDFLGVQGTVKSLLQHHN